jgi:hypothetical protein
MHDVNHKMRFDTNNSSDLIPVDRKGIFNYVLNLINAPTLNYSESLTTLYTIIFAFLNNLTIQELTILINTINKPSFDKAYITHDDEVPINLDIHLLLKVFLTVGSDSLIKVIEAILVKKENSSLSFSKFRN